MRGNNQTKRSSTWNAQQKQQLQRIKQEISPVITVRSCRTNPPSKPASIDYWITRNIRIYAKTDSSGIGSVAGSQVALALGLAAPETSFIKVLAIKAWNSTSQQLSSNYIRAESAIELTSDGSYRIGEDTGNGASLPGTQLNIPDTISSRLSLTTTTTGIYVKFSTSPVAGIGGSNIVTLDLTVKYQV